MTAVADYQEISIPFHDHEILGIRDSRDSSYHLPFRPLCERLELQFSAQLKRLKRNHWATVSVMDTVGLDGKNREMVTINRKTFSMWLATLVASRIPDEAVRKRIELYQLEAVDALDRHFFGPPQTSTPSLDPRVVQVELLNSMVRAQVKARQSNHAAKIDGIESDLAITAFRLKRVEADSARALLAATGEVGRYALSSWAREQGINLGPSEAKREGRIVKGLCDAAGLKTGTLRRGNGEGYAVCTYPQAILRDWLEGYLLRQHRNRPTLFQA